MNCTETKYFVCVDNTNCPVNYHTTNTKISYHETYAIPDKKNETCCPKCNSILFEKGVYDAIVLFKKNKKKRLIIYATISIVAFCILVIYLYTKN